MAIPHILVVDDDQDMRSMLKQYLVGHGFPVHTASSGAEVESVIDRHRIDAILLDVMLADESGITICRKLRETNSVPVIMVSALSSDHHRMRGYESCADDYIAKPFNPELLLARLRAVVRRAGRSPSLAYRRDNHVYRFACWRFDGRKSELTAEAGFQVALSRRETGLLKCLLANPFVALTREEIAAAIEEARDPGAPVDANPGRAIDVLVGRLRTKLEGEPGSPQIIQTVRGAGYMLAVEVESSDAG